MSTKLTTGLKLSIHINNTYTRIVCIACVVWYRWMSKIKIKYMRVFFMGIPLPLIIKYNISTSTMYINRKNQKRTHVQPNRPLTASMPLRYHY